MGTVNKVMLIGNLGRDAEVRYTQSGTPMATLNLATSESWKDKSGQQQSKTEWHRCVLWGKMAETLQDYLVKGKQLYLEGRLQTREFDDAKTGQKRYMTEVRADRVVLLGGTDRGDRGRTARREDEPLGGSELPPGADDFNPDALKDV